MTTDSKPKKIRKKIFASWIITMVSITLVLVMLGALVFLLFGANRLSDYLREKIGFTLVLKEDINENNILALQKKLNALPYVKSSRFIHKDSAAIEFSRELGEDFVGFLGYNPLFSSMEVKLYSPYTRSDSLNLIENRLLALSEVTEVYFQKDLVFIINQNTGRISVILFIISALLTFICIALISNTIRISIYSKRFSINVMQMVGASDGYIIKPFLEKSLYWGTWAALIANGLVIGAYIWLKRSFDGEITQDDLFASFVVFSVVVISGICISIVSTWFSVNKFLKMKFDELFY